MRPGARRVLCAASRQDIEATAFRNVDGSAVVVLLNRTVQSQRLTLRIDDAAGARTAAAVDRHLRVPKRGPVPSTP